MGGIDLHSHTDASDGALDGRALVTRAQATGIRTLAVTDHDTLSAFAAAREVGEALGVDVIPGIELSTVHGKRGLHVLGYLFDVDDPHLLDLLEVLSGARERRAHAIAGRLEALGKPVNLDDVRRIAGGSAIARPHFARALVERGYVSNVDDAFDRWLGDGRPAHVVVEALSAKRAIDVIHSAGGVASLAHPLTYGRDPRGVELLVRELAAAGLDGLEVFYGPYTQGEIAMLACHADRYGLIATGGSDFHEEPGPPCPDLPHDVLDRLRARAEAR